MSNKILLSFLLLLFSSNFLFSNNQEFKKDSIRARELYFNGIALARNSLYQNAIDSFKLSLEIRKRLFGINSYDAGMVQNALGINYKNTGNLDKSIEHYLLAEKAYLNEISTNEPAIARLYSNIGNVYKIKLNYEIALDYFQRALNIYERNTSTAKEDISEVYYNIAEVFYKQNKYDNTIDILNQHYHYAYDDTKLLYLSLKAASLKELNLINEAYKTYLQTIEYAIKYYSDVNYNVVFEYLNFANFLIDVNDFSKAKQILNTVNDILTKIDESENNIYAALYLKTWGVYYMNLKIESKNIETFKEQKTSYLLEGIRFYQNSLKVLGVKIENLSNDNQYAENTFSLPQSLELLKLIADCYSQIYDIYSDSRLTAGIEALNKALEYYDITGRLIQQARKSMFSDEDKIQLAELEEATFFKMIETAYKSFKVNPKPEILEFAFTNAERMKASSVFDRLSEQFAKENSLIPDSITERERALNYNITSQNEKIFRLTSTEHHDSVEIYKTDSLLFQLKKQRDDLNRYLENNFGDYYEMKYSNSMMGVTEVQKKLKNNEILIEYVLVENNHVPDIYAFVISPDEAGFYKLDTDHSFIPSLEKTYRFISNPGYLFTRNNNSKEYCSAAHFLYSTLLKPFEEFTHHKKITIIPDGKLSYLPFDALLTEMPDTSGMIQFNTLPYLIRTNSVNYSYSANLLYNFKKHGRKARNRLLAFAPEYNFDTIRFDNDKLVLTPLPGIQREIELIAREINSRLFKGSEATEETFRRESKDYDILHLAMHAFINDSMPAFSRLAFTQNHETNAENDGWLNTADIYNLDLKARLTVLSACNTGSGNLRRGEGVMSLARGFLYAGCPSIIMTLWEVEDNAGTEIMRSFYRILKKGRRTDDALRQAKLKYLENANPRMAHPHYWLSYVSIGATDPLFRSYDFYFFGALIIFLTAITIDQLIKMRKNRRYKKK